MLWRLVAFPSFTAQPKTRLTLRGLAKASVIAVRPTSRVLARFRKKPAYFEPDPYVTEVPFLSERWPGQ